MNVTLDTSLLQVLSGNQLKVLIGVAASLYNRKQDSQLISLGLIARSIGTNPKTVRDMLLQMCQQGLLECYTDETARGKIKYHVKMSEKMWNMVSFKSA
jgi:DNA-binding IclR family transcriptional regulator